MRGMNQNQENEKPQIKECGWGHGERSEETLDLVILCRDPICRFECKWLDLNNTKNTYMQGLHAYIDICKDIETESRREREGPTCTGGVTEI